MTPLRWHLFLGLGGVGMLAWLALTGTVIGTPQSEVVPTSVRDNPASYRPAYVGYYGWTSRPTSGSGGGYRVGK